jgi:hypothetical protein
MLLRHTDLGGQGPIDEANAVESWPIGRDTAINDVTPRNQDAANVNVDASGHVDYQATAMSYGQDVPHPSRSDRINEHIPVPAQDGDAAYGNLSGSVDPRVPSISNPIPRSVAVRAVSIDDTTNNFTNGERVPSQDPVATSQINGLDVNKLFSSSLLWESGFDAH